MGLSLLGGAVTRDRGLVMGDLLHIDDAIATWEEAAAPLDRKAIGRYLALCEVRNGEIVTDADVKVDQLYQALAETADPLFPRRDPEFDGIPNCGRWGEMCSLCRSWHRRTDIESDFPHAKGCVYADAVEYVKNNPRQDS